MVNSQQALNLILASLFAEKPELPFSLVDAFAIRMLLNLGYKMGERKLSAEFEGLSFSGQKVVNQLIRTYNFKIRRDVVEMINDCSPTASLTISLEGWETRSHDKLTGYYVKTIDSSG